MGISTAFHPLGGGGKRKIEVAIADDTNNINLYTLAGSPKTAVALTVNVAAGVVVGAEATEGYAVTTGVFPANSEIIINVGANAYISGAGGAGGTGGSLAGSPGGPAICLEYPVSIHNAGVIQSGGKGGNCGGSTYGGGGGGGAGAVAGTGGTGTNNGGAGKIGTLTAGGAGGTRGSYTTTTPGGNAWLGGTTTTTYGNGGTAGGAPGSVAAVITNGHALTWIVQGTVTGEIS